MKFKAIKYFVCLLILVLLSSFFLSSCKKENCSETRYYLLDRDTTVIPYTGFETLEFIVEDSLGNFLDSVKFKGAGKNKYFQDSDVENLECGAIVYDKQNIDFTYINENNSNEKLIFTIRKTEANSNFYIKVVSNNFKNLFYEGRVTTFYNSNLASHHDTLTIKNKLYFTVIKILGSGSNSNSAYFGRFDGLLSLEQDKNRIWYKIN